MQVNEIDADQDGIIEFPENPEVTVERAASDEEPFAGQAFQIMNDSFVGVP